MNEARTPNTRRLIIVAVILVIFSTVMVFWAREVIREVVVLPLSYLYWLFGVLIRMTPQIFFWGVLLFLSFIFAWRNLTSRKKVVADNIPSLANEIPSDTNSGRAVFWSSRVNLLRSSRSGYRESAFHQAVVRLLLDLLSYRYHLPVRQVEADIREGTLDIPAEVREYILAHHNRLEPSYSSFFDEVWQSLLERLRGWWGKLTANRTADNVPLDPQVAYILNYMEEELEVPHDSTDR